MTHHEQAGVDEDNSGPRPGFALRSDLAGRRVSAALAAQTQSESLWGSAIERRPWGNLVWSARHGQPAVTCVAVIAPRLSWPRRLLARPGLPAATIGGVAGYPFAYPVTVGVAVAVVVLLVALLAWAGGSMAWEGALLIAIAPAAWHSIGVVVRARSGLLRRVDDPTHLETLGRVDAALTGLHDLADGAPVLASSVEEFWWAAAACPRSASLCAEELEALLNSRASQRKRSLGLSPRADSGASQPIHAVLQHRFFSAAELQDRFYSVADQYRPYETDIEKVSTAPQLSDLSHPATHAFVTALLATQDALQALEVGAVTTAQAQGAVHELEVCWRAAEESAHGLGYPASPQDEHTRSGAPLT